MTLIRHSLMALIIGLRLIQLAFANWVIIALVIFFTADTVPHLRLNDLISHKLPRCTYLGASGAVQVQRFTGCPWLIMLNPKDGTPLHLSIFD